VAQVGADSALAIDGIIERRKIVNWAQNADVQNRMRNDIDDHLFEVKDRYSLAIPILEIDAAVERCLDVARVRKAS
jgi:type I restriction enzyme, R subunit